MEQFYLVKKLAVKGGSLKIIENDTAVPVLLWELIHFISMKFYITIPPQEGSFLLNMKMPKLKVIPFLSNERGT